MFGNGYSGGTRYFDGLNEGEASTERRSNACDYQCEQGALFLGKEGGHQVLGEAGMGPHLSAVLVT